MKEEQTIGGQWASEAYNLIRLFYHMGRSWWGLLLLLIGWTCFLVLASKLSFSVPPGQIELPWIADGAMFRAFSIAKIYSIGCLLILLAWIVLSGLFHYFTFPFAYLIRHLFIILNHILALALFIAALPVTAISLPIEKLLIRRWKAQQNSQKLQDVIDKDGLEALNSFAKQQVGFRADWLINFIAKGWIAASQSLSSRGTIGIAPLFGISYEEQFRSAKASVQTTARVVELVYQKIGRLGATRFIRFRMLPSLIGVRSLRGASATRRIMGLDVLLWGSYLTTEPPTVWLNFDGRRVLRKNEDDDVRSLERRISPSAYSPFREDNASAISTVVVSQDSPRDLYIVLTIAVARALDQRRERRPRLGPWWSDKLHIAFGEPDAIRSQLIRDVLFSIDAPLTPDLEYPTAGTLVVDLASDWIARKLEEIGRPDPWKENELEFMQRVIERCCDLVPNNPNHHYRLAAIMCIHGDEEGTKDALNRGFSNEKDLATVDPINLTVLANMAVELLGFFPKANEVATTLVHVYRLVRARPKEKESLRKMVSKKAFVEYGVDRDISSGSSALGVKLILQYLDYDPQSHP